MKVVGALQNGHQGNKQNRQHTIGHTQQKS
jgi:hypothetical protein